VEVAALVVAVPRTAGTTWAAGSVVAGPAWSVVAGPAWSVVAGPAWSVVAGPAWSVVTGTTWSSWAVVAGAARSTGSTGSTWSVVAGAARSTGSGSAWTTGSARPVASPTRLAGCRSAVVNRGRRAVGPAGTGWRSRSGAGRTGTHTQRGCPKSAGDANSGHQLLQFHGPSPVYLGIQGKLAPHVSER
jgi:hypothetical protein